MIWLILVTLHLAALVSYTLLLRKSALGKLDNTLMAALMQTAVFIPSVIFLLFGKVSFDHTLQQWLFLLFGGVMLAGLMLTNVWALSKLDASLFTIIYNLRLLVVTILGYVFLGELPAPLQMAGGAIILVSIIMLNLHKNKTWRSTPILVGFFAMFWFSAHAVLEKYNLSQINIESYLFIFTLIGTILMWALVALKRINILNQVAHINDNKIYLLLMTRSLSAYAYVYALKYGSLAITNYVSGMGVVLIVLFGIILLKERSQMKQKLASVAVACVGLTLILISKLN